MNIFLKELKDYRKALFFWSLAIVAFMVSALSKYQGYRKSGTSINEIIESLPAGLSAVLGFTGLDLQSAGGFFAMSAFYLSLMLGVHAVLIGSGIISKEETDKTIEFLASRPVSRNRIILFKLLAAFTTIVFLNAVTAITSVVIVPLFNEGQSINRDIALLMPSVFFIQLWFLMIGASFAAMMRCPKRAGMYSAAVLLAALVVSSFVDASGRFSFLKYLTPFKYFDAKTIFFEGRYSVWFIVITVAAVAALLAASAFRYRNRDLNV